MARARNIKPGFFKNEILGVADPLYSLLFEGLWVLADRAGRLEDRPLRIKGEVFPYRDGLDMDAMLNWLQENGFIQRYTSHGKKCILVTEFVKHQNPHKNETESELPAPESKQTKPEIIGTTSETIGSTRADSLSTDSLIPDSPTTDSLNSEANASVAKATGKKTSEPMDDKDKIFTYGVPMLVNAGSTDKAARSFLAGLAKGHGDASVVQALRDCIKAKAIDPLTWLAGVLPPSGAGPTKKVQPVSFKQSDADDGMRRWEEQTGRVHPDRHRNANHGQVIDVTPKFQELSQ